MVKLNSSFSFDDSELKKLQRKINALPKQMQIPLPDDFISKYTEFESFQEMVDASGIEKAEEIGNKEFSEFVSAHTQFSSWEEMTKAVTIEYIRRRLGF